MENQMELKISIPEGYEIDKEQSSFDKIILKKKIKEIKTWEDLIGEGVSESSVFIDSFSNILKDPHLVKYNYESRNFFIDPRHAKSALAMAQISQLMPYYGGQILEEEWKNSITKYIILKRHLDIEFNNTISVFQFLAFHTREQRDSFYKNNEQLVKDYLMIGLFND